MGEDGLGNSYLRDYNFEVLQEEFREEAERNCRVPEACRKFLVVKQIAPVNIEKAEVKLVGVGFRSYEDLRLPEDAAGC